MFHSVNRNRSVLEAALHTGPDFSYLSCFSEPPECASHLVVAERWDELRRMNLLDVATLSGDTVIVQLLRDRGMQT